MSAGGNNNALLDLTWPAERFYWALLDAPGYTGRGGVLGVWQNKSATARPLPSGLLAMLADEIPRPVEEVFAVGWPVSGGRVLVCAAAREELAALDESVRSLGPAGLPPGIEIAEVDLPRLGAGLPGAGAGVGAGVNLLVGEFEPASLRKARWKRHLARAAVVGLVSALLVIGLARRAAYWREVERDARAAYQELVVQALGEGIPPEHALLALDAELDHLRQLDRFRPSAPTDASMRLASLLTAWPTSVPSKPQSVAVNESGVTVSVSLEGDPGPFLAAFKAPPGWTLEEPRLSTAGTVTRLTLRLRPEATVAAAAVPGVGAGLPGPGAGAGRTP